MKDPLALSLDDRDYDDLVRLAKEAARARCPEWDVDAVGDPGTTLLELFAYLTDVLIYRVNRIPEKSWRAFLQLLGLALEPPRAASTRLVLRLDPVPKEDFILPRGLQVAAKEDGGQKGQRVVFTTVEDLRWPAGKSEVSLIAHHAEAGLLEVLPLRRVGEEWWGQIERPPLIRLDPAEGRDLQVYLPWPVPADAADPLLRRKDIDGVPHRILEERDLLRPSEPGCFTIHRTTGLLRMRPLLPPGTPADAPPPRLRVSAFRGGGATGNLRPQQLTRLLTPVRPGLTVLQPERASGGREAETLEAALARAPREFRRMERAVSADDYETLARAASGAVGRAKAFTAKDLFPHAPLATVDVFLVPHIDEQTFPAGVLPDGLLAEHQRNDVLETTAAALERQKPLGTAVRVRWAPVRKVMVHLELVAHRDEDPIALAARVQRALEARLQPFDRGRGRQGWTFGAPLRRHLVDQLVVQEPGVRYTKSLRFELGEGPDAAIKVIARDPHRPLTWIVGLDPEAVQGPVLYRSLNDGKSFEPLIIDARAVGVLAVALHPTRPGWIAVVLRRKDRGGLVLSSFDLGETWSEVAATDQQINDAVFVDLAGSTSLYLATDQGLFEAPIGSAPVRRTVDQKAPDLGFTRCALARLMTGDTVLVLAAREEKGVYAAVLSGAEFAFQSLGPKATDVRSFAIETSGGRTFLWAGLGAENDAEGLGVQRRELRKELGTEADWAEPPRGWLGGSCHALALAGTTLCAATHRGGVLRLDLADPKRWKAIDINRGLGLGAREFVRIDALAVDRDPRRILVGSADGLRRSEDGGETYARVATRTFDDAVFLPPHGLFLSGQHEVIVRPYDDDDPEGVRP